MAGNLSAYPASAVGLRSPCIQAFNRRAQDQRTQIGRIRSQSPSCRRHVPSEKTISDAVIITPPFSPFRSTSWEGPGQTMDASELWDETPFEDLLTMTSISHS